MLGGDAAYGEVAVDGDGATAETAGLNAGAAPKVGAVVAALKEGAGARPGAESIVGGGTRSAVVNGFVTVVDWLLLHPTTENAAAKNA